MSQQELGLLRLLAGGVIAVILIDLSLLAAHVVSRRRTDHQGLPPFFASRWSVLDLWIALHIFVAGIIPFGIVAAIVMVILAGGSMPERPAGAPLLALLGIGMVGQTILMIGIPIAFITQKYRLSLNHVGLAWPPPKEHVRLGVKWGLFLLIVAGLLRVGIVLILNGIMGPSEVQELRRTTEQMTAEGLIKQFRTPMMYVMFMIVAGIMAPVSEEIFFRGFMYNIFKHRLGIKAGVVLSALLFALVHGAPIAIISIIPMGMILALAYERTRSLWIPIVMHATNNMIAVSLTFLMPNLDI
jgi:membrane protease YdiL (CAAX protease family)